MKLADHISGTARQELLEVMESIQPYLRSANLQLVDDDEDEDEEESDEEEDEDDTESDDETEVEAAETEDPPKD